MAADKPSDFVDEAPAPSGSGRRRVMTILGVGCGGLMLLVGLLFALGAFKAVSCCGDTKQLVLRTEQVSLQARVFADALVQGQLEQAYGLLSEQARSGMTQAAFADQIGPHAALIRQSVPLPGRVAPLVSEPQGQQGLEAIKHIDQWALTLRFFPSAQAEPGSAEVVMTLRAAHTAQSTPEAPQVRFELVELRQRPVLHASEPPAQRVVELHRRLQLDGPAAGYAFMDLAFQREHDAAAFEAFIQSQGDLFERGALEVNQVSYQPQPPTVAATVTTTLTSPTQRAVVTFGLLQGPLGWGVVSIAPLIQTPAQAPTTPPQDQAPDDAPASDETPQATP